MVKGLKPETGQVGHIGHEKANDEVSQPSQGGQDQVGGPQVPLLGHGEGLEP